MLKFKYKSVELWKYTYDTVPLDTPVLLHPDIWKFLQKGYGNRPPIGSVFEVFARNYRGMNLRYGAPYYSGILWRYNLPDPDRKIFK